MSLVRISRVTKRYGDRLVLRDVSFRLRAGERVGLLGRNGAGKTTLLRLILGQEDPDEGGVDVTQGIRLGYFSQFSDHQQRRVQPDPANVEQRLDLWDQASQFLQASIDDRELATVMVES